MMPTLDELYKPIQPQLSAVQEEVSRYWDEVLRLIHGPSLSPPKVGGKLLRPALCLLAAGGAGARELDSFVPMAAACELLHLAALTHDDVIDRADLRRGMTSLNALWDNHTAVLSGDYLVARAIMLLTSLGSCALIESTVNAVRRMAGGELTGFARNAERFTEEDCLRLAEDKTATYFAATCVSPTYLVGEIHRNALHEFGLAFGIAFQLIDDVLDLMQNPESLGKPSCGDIVEGKRTLPILFMRDAAAPADRDRLNQMIGRAISDQDRAWAAALMDQTGARAKTEATARAYADRARAALAPLTGSVYKDAMLGLVEFVLIRES